MSGLCEEPGAVRQGRPIKELPGRCCSRGAVYGNYRRQPQPRGGMGAGSQGRGAGAPQPQSFSFSSASRLSCPQFWSSRIKTIMTIAKKKPFRWNISPQPLLQWHMDVTNPSGNGAPPGGAGEDERPLSLPAYARGAGLAHALSGS